MVYHGATWCYMVLHGVLWGNIRNLFQGGRRRTFNSCVLAINTNPEEEFISEFGEFVLHVTIAWRSVQKLNKVINSTEFARYARQ